MMTKYQTEKRMANVGERILITKATMAFGKYANGDIKTVERVESGGVYVKNQRAGLFHTEYEVIVEEANRQPAPPINSRITALETEVSELKAKVDALEKAVKYPLTTKFNREFDAETNAKADAIMAELKRKSQPTVISGWKHDPKFHAKTPNEQRADVIKRAKAFVSEGYDRWFCHKLCTVEYVINSDKRTVVALLRGKPYKNVVSKGIAKCDPDDVFNADIGKAIALARALGVEVPTEFVKAVQPTEVVAGMRTFHYYEDGSPVGKRVVNKVVYTDGEIRVTDHTEHGLWGHVTFDEGDRILDDTDAVYE